MFSDWRYGHGNGTTPFLGCRRRGGEVVPPLSARKLAASLWRFADTGETVSLHCGLLFNRLRFQRCSSMPPVLEFAMEGATKWDYCNDSRAWDCADDFESSKLKLTSSRKHVNIEGEAGGSRKMIEERDALRMKKEQQRRIWSVNVMKKLAEAIERERKVCKSINRMNIDMLRDTADAKALTRKLICIIEREKKTRRELERVCYDLANEIRGTKAEIAALRNEQRRIKEGMEKEKEMRQVAEVWREEGVQMKLADAKLILDDKNAELNELMDVLREFVRRSKLSTAGVSAAVTSKGAPESPVEAASGKELAVVEDANANSSQVLDKGGVVTVTHEAESLNNKMRRGNQNMSKTKRILMHGRNPHADIEWPKAAKLDGHKMPLQNLLKHNSNSA